MSPPAKNGHLSPAAAETQDAKPNTGFDHVSEQLEAQLPDFTTETVPLGFLVDRLASDVYKDLHALAETCVQLVHGFYVENKKDSGSRRLNADCPR